MRIVLDDEFCFDDISEDLVKKKSREKTPMLITFIPVAAKFTATVAPIKYFEHIRARAFSVDPNLDSTPRKLQSKQ